MAASLRASRARVAMTGPVPPASQHGVGNAGCMVIDEASGICVIFALIFGRILGIVVSVMRA